MKPPDEIVVQGGTCPVGEGPLSGNCSVSFAGEILIGTVKHIIPRAYGRPGRLHDSTLKVGTFFKEQPNIFKFFLYKTQIFQFLLYWPKMCFPSLPATRYQFVGASGH